RRATASKKLTEPVEMKALERASGVAVMLMEFLNISVQQVDLEAEMSKYAKKINMSKKMGKMRKATNMLIQLKSEQDGVELYSDLAGYAD
ncbi:hypothetical protein CYMTET_25386, partial [Cymbomonas tetramitiformis]